MSDSPLSVLGWGTVTRVGYNHSSHSSTVRIVLDQINITIGIRGGFFVEVADDADYQPEVNDQVAVVAGGSLLVLPAEGDYARPGRCRLCKTTLDNDGYCTDAGCELVGKVPE